MQESLLFDLIGLRVSRETLERLRHFAELFEKWSRTINLVAASTQSDMWTRHIADSAQIFALSPEPKQWVDLGSGGGFPGVITAILLAEAGAGWVHLVESNHKKAGFLRVALSETGARGSVHACRIEEAHRQIQHCDAISARALAVLDVLFDFAAPWVERNPDLHCFFHKGRDYQTEVDKAHGRWSFDLLQHQSAIETDSVILEIARLTRKI
ncbi:16S rRNA (guanine(527)-N(7))-methyltransferase RsmG [Ciceribacter thiooxidans]|uniref:Ribosomal RNA small subunit methyltransferase G n=1 Tax=Ciceribacter thiooxidans TaxID=1969821 RepID=A0ABV7HTI0_9HYPH|nr:16S rRNA (guanine(527)-N(7))-methyltransferase RsmG [Ciceribacter thiooxidans]